MDLNALVRLIFLEKNDLTFGVLMALTLIVVVLLLVRSVIDEKEGVSGGSAGAVDSKALSSAMEGALKKAIAQGAVIGSGTPAASGAAGASAQAGGPITPEAAELKKVLSEREAKIASLLSDIEVLKTHSEASGGLRSAGKDGSGTDGAASTDPALLAKINELQAKLSEYEIIEDDIADLSSYKEENKKLKEEIEKIKSATLTARDQVQSVQAAVQAPGAESGSLKAAQSAVMDSSSPPQAPQTPQASEVAPPTSFKLDANDDVMNEFAKALAESSSGAAVAPTVEVTATDEFANLVVSGSAVVDPQAAIDALLAGSPEAAPVAAAPAAATEPAAPVASAVAAGDPPESDPFGVLDTDKMLEEVASLGTSEGAADTSSVLDDALDTDRLMAEMGLEEAPPAAAATATVAPSVNPVEAPPPAVAAVSTPTSQAPVDDLLAEFNDTDFQAANKTPKKE